MPIVHATQAKLKILPITAVDLLDQSYGSSASQITDIYLPGGRSKEETPLLVTYTVGPG